MRHEDRGMVKYAPYKSLVEQATYLARIQEEYKYVEKRQLSQDQAEEINEILTHYDGEVIRIEYWKSGKILQECGVIWKIDPFQRMIYINETKIALNALQSLSICA